MSEAVFSVIVPTCSRDDALALCLDQLRPEVQQIQAQVIVTDDGSSETTRRLIEGRYPFATWTQGPRRGPAANRNHGASLATGDFMIFIDDDVFPSPELLQAYKRAITDGVNVYEGRTTCRAGVHSPLETAPANETGGYLWSCNMMVRAEFFRTFGGFDEDFRFAIMEDVAFRERLRAAGETFPFVPAASVDHPPRKIPSARRRTPVHESHFLYYYKYMGHGPTLRKYMMEFANHNLRLIARCPLGPDSIVALGSRCLEAYYVLLHWRSWDRRYRGFARFRPSAVEFDARRLRP